MTLFEHSISLQNEILKALGELPDDEETPAEENTNKEIDDKDEITIVTSSPENKDNIEEEIIIDDKVLEDEDTENKNINKSPVKPTIETDAEVDKDDIFSIDISHEDILTPTLPFSVEHVNSDDDVDIIKKVLSNDLFTGGKNVIDMIGDNLQGGVLNEQQLMNSEIFKDEEHDLISNVEKGTIQGGVLNEETVDSTNKTDSTSDEETDNKLSNFSPSPFDQIYESEKEDNSDTNNPFDQIYPNSDDSSSNISDDSEYSSENFENGSALEEHATSRNYTDIINELKDYDNSTYTLSGGSVPVTRVRIINAFPYIIKSNTTK